MKIATQTIAVLLAVLVTSQVTARELVNSATLWVCQDTQLAHGICTSEWADFPESGLFGGADFRFKCQLFRNSVRKVEDTWVLENVASSGTQVSALLETPLTGFTANYCTMNFSELSTGVSTHRDSTQYCRPYTTSSTEP